MEKLGKVKLTMHLSIYNLTYMKTNSPSIHKPSQNGTSWLLNTSMNVSSVEMF